MSEQKVIKGFAIEHGGWIEFDVAPDENGPWRPATIYIGSGKLYTEAEYLEAKDGRWVPVSEAMPEELETVWLANPNHNIVFLGCWSQDSDGNWCWSASNGTTYVEKGRIVAECEDDDLDVTHWMRLPLPLPPQS